MKDYKMNFRGKISLLVLTCVVFFYIVHLFIAVEIYSKCLSHINPKNNHGRTDAAPQPLEATTYIATPSDTTTESITTALPVDPPSSPRDCTGISKKQKGPIEVNFDGGNSRGNWPPSFEEIALKYPSLELGGYHPGPEGCKNKHNVSIIVPYRDREEHLRFFLYYTHMILERQPISYKIYIVEQDDSLTFNKGQLMNTGYRYAFNQTEFSSRCIFFHDVDTICEDDRTPYTCRGENEVLHLSPRIDKYNYRFCCGITVGGVLGFQSHQFEKINGFSNVYYGWGGEDDDVNYRLVNIGKFSVYRPPEEYIKYKMIRHDKDEKNAINGQRHKILNKWRGRQPTDGLNSLETQITKVIKYPTHTRIFVKPKPQK